MNNSLGLRIIFCGFAAAILVNLAGCVLPKTTEAAPAISQTQTTAGSTLQSLAELDAKPPESRRLNIQSWMTAEGAKVLFVEARELPMIDVNVTFAAGSHRDNETPGLAILTNAMLNEGIAHKDTKAIADAFASVGATFYNDVDRDTAFVQLRSLSAPEFSIPAVTLFAEVVGKPVLQERAFLNMKRQLFERAKQTKGVLEHEIYTRIYGDHPYAQSVVGTPKGLEALTPAHIDTFHRQAYTAKNAVFSIVGDLSRTEAEAMSAQLSAALPEGPALPRVPDIKQSALPKSPNTHYEAETAQVGIVLGQLGIARNDPDYAAVLLGNQIFGGGGFGSRLMSELREKRGMTYGVYSQLHAWQAPGPFLIDLQTFPEFKDSALKLIQGTLSDYLENGPTQKELDEAKRQLAGSFPRSTASSEAILGQLSIMGFHDLPLDSLETFMQQSQKLTVEQVKNAMNRHISIDKMLVSTGGPTVPQKPLPAPTGKPSEASLGVAEH